MTSTATVVGGGPAGLIAAERLAAAGLEVTVVDHAASVGRKFLLAGRGGLNLTHGEPFDRFLTRYGDAAPYLRPALEAFDPAALRAWCAGLGEPTFVGSSGRVFPTSFRATPLLRAWIRRLGDLGVRFETRTRWLGWDDGGHRVVGPDGAERDVSTDVCVLALGGASWPRVGSDGGWVSACRMAGIEVTELRAANVRLHVDWSPVFRERWAGEPLKNVAVTIAERTVRGEPIVTEHGLEGGPIYAVGDLVRSRLDRDGSCELRIDLLPDLSRERLVERLQRRRPKDSTTTWLRRIGLPPVAVALLRESTGNALPSDVATLAELVRAVPVRVTGTASIARAISSSGGIAWSEIDARFMLRRRPGTFVAGEMIDWEAPTGGYLLQACFSTGVAAADGAIAWLAGSA
jgi:uncharacterized flavoprotein (TIGR03862 family)